MKRCGLRDDQFLRIEHLLPGRPGHVGRNSVEAADAIVPSVRRGAPVLLELTPRRPAPFGRADVARLPKDLETDDAPRSG
jgi:hypothetical protein